MGKLMSAALMRLRLSWVFWGCLAATVVCSNFVTTTVTLSGPGGERGTAPTAPTSTWT